MKVKDGTAEFMVRDQRMKAMIDFFFPVGAIYTCVVKPPWIDEYGEWKEVGAGCVLWGADSNHDAGTSINAGLPNINGSFNHSPWSTNSPTGAFFSKSTTPNTINSPDGSSKLKWNICGFDASKSNSIYGSSDTVQPPAYVVHFYQRIS